MESQTLIPGLKFAVEKDLTGKEMEVFGYFLKSNFTAVKLAEVMDVPKTTLHHTIQRLKLKGLIVLEGKDTGLNMIYRHNLPVELPSRE